MQLSSILRDDDFPLGSFYLKKLIWPLADFTGHTCKRNALYGSHKSLFRQLSRVIQVDRDFHGAFPRLLGFFSYIFTINIPLWDVSFIFSMLPIGILCNTCWFGKFVLWFICCHSAGSGECLSQGFWVHRDKLENIRLLTEVEVEVEYKIKLG